MKNVGKREQATAVHYERPMISISILSLLGVQHGLKLYTNLK
jgi:hypothetical protein